LYIRFDGFVLDGLFIEANKSRPMIRLKKPSANLQDPLLTSLVIGIYGGGT